MISNPRHGSPPRLMAYQPTRCSTTQESSIRVHRPDPVLQGGLRLLRLSSTPSAITLPCGRASVLRRDEWGLPCCPRGSCDRGGCALSSGGSWCHRRQWCHLAIRPADLLVQATSLLGLFYGYGL